MTETAQSPCRTITMHDTTLGLTLAIAYSSSEAISIRDRNPQEVGVFK